MRRALLVLVIVKVAAIAAYAFIVRPRLRLWGTTPEERAMHVPGDDMVERAHYHVMHAITVDAPPRDVWPWLVQIGQGRGGFYSYERIENLVGCDIHNADQIVEGWQDLSEGDTIRLAPGGPGQAPGFDVLLVDPHRALVLVTPGSPGSKEAERWGYGTWAFLLGPTSSGATRLLTRMRMQLPAGPAGRLYGLLLEPIHGVMQRKMMLGIKGRAEREARHPDLAAHPHLVP